MYRRFTSLVACSFFVAVTLGAGVNRADDENPIVQLVKSKAKDPTRPFAITVTFKVKAGKEKDLEAAFKPCLAATRKEAGCIAYELNRDTDDPTIYVMFEKFRSVKALQDHLKETHTQTLLKTVGMLTEGDAKVLVYTAPE